MQITEADNKTRFLYNAYSIILPEFIETLSAEECDYATLFGHIYELFEKILSLSELPADFAIFWSDNLYYGEKLSVPFIKPCTTPEERLTEVLNFTAELLASSSVMAPAAIEDAALPGYTLAIPIRCAYVDHGYIVIYYCEKTADNVKIYAADSPQAEFLYKAMSITALINREDSGKEKLEQYLMNDYLTELPNRTYLYEAIVYSLQSADIAETRFSLLMIRVNGLKPINNSLGITVGDMMLKEMGLLIKNAVEQLEPATSTLVGRLSGGDFIVLITYSAINSNETNAINTVRKYCEAVIEKTKKPIVINDFSLYPSVSIGASIFPYHGETPELLLRRADLAKNTAKQEGNNKYHIYKSLMEGDSDKVLFLNNSLPTAIAAKQFELYYQAQIDIATGRITGAEALIRWRHPERGMIYPGDFIQFAEDNGYGIQIDMIVLERVCEQIERWSKKGFDLSVGVNISPKHFVNGLICNTIGKILADRSVEASRLKIELLENTLLEGFDIAVKTIKGLQELGVAIALDDFGSGYSSLEYVAMLPMDYLKLDRTFTMHLDERPSNKIILETIMTLAKGMKVKTIAEGVETQSHLDYLRSLGCDQAQGYFINKPMPVEDFEQLLIKNLNNCRA